MVKVFGLGCLLLLEKYSKPLPMAEVAALINCDIHELGQMVARVVDFLELKLPEFDIVNLYEYGIWNCPSFNGI